MKKQRLSFHTPPEQNFQPPDPPPQYAESKIPYASTWRMPKLNCKGLNSQSKREQIMEIMHQLNHHTAVYQADLLDFIDFFKPMER